VLYPKFTLLDFAGANEVFARLTNVEVRIANPDGGAIGVCSRDVVTGSECPCWQASSNCIEAASVGGIFVWRGT
jgi:hypothetical protein